MKPDLNIREVAEFPVTTIPHLLSEDYNEQIKGDRGVSVVRLDTKEIVSNMSSIYQLVKHSDVLDAVEATLSANNVKFNLINMMMFSTKNSSMRARYQLTNVESNGYNPIIDVSNSYDGITRFHCQFGVWRQVCSNGMFGWTKSSFYDKIHIRESVSLTGLFNSLDQWLNQEFPKLMFNIEDMMRKNAVSIEVLGKFFRPREMENFLISETMDKYNNQFGNNRWSQLQAVTEFAQTLDTERRIYCETNILKTLNYN